jgi:thiol-disulfide isomerase/thioredoxin
MGSAARTRARAGARTNAKARNARQKIAARRAADHKAQVRRRLLLAGGSVTAMLALVATLIAVKLSQPPARSAPAASTRTTAQVQQQVTNVPAATFNAVGTGTATGLKTVTGQPTLTSGGKPEMLYMGGEFCPYCAAERWALATAVSRFGTLSGLSLIHSSPADVYASTPTLSFAGAHYTSKYLAFAPVEWYGEADDPSTPFGHAYLQQPTAQQQALFTRYDGNSIPFVDIGNRYFLPQPQYIPSALAGMSWAQIAAATHDPSSTVAKDIDGAANIITAAICALTHGQPSGVCLSAGVKAAAGSI